MANMEKIADKLAILPALPGCYLMKNVRGDIIYVGEGAQEPGETVFCRRT